jgi:hypothetical protein
VLPPASGRLLPLLPPRPAPFKRSPSKPFVSAVPWSPLEVYQNCPTPTRSASAPPIPIRIRIIHRIHRPPSTRTTTKTTTPQPPPAALHSSLPTTTALLQSRPLHRPRRRASEPPVTCETPALASSSRLSQPRPPKWRQKYACSTADRPSKPLALCRVRPCNAGAQTKTSADRDYRSSSGNTNSW